MSKARFSKEDTIRIGLVEKVEIDGEVHWKVAKNAPSWVYKYLMQRGIDKDNMTFNRFATEECADWIRVHEPEKAIATGLADTMKFQRYPGARVGTYGLRYTGVQFSDSKGDHWIRLTSPLCPAAMVEYVLTRHPGQVDDLYGRVRSDVFMTDEFANWICEHDKELADLLDVGSREAVRFSEPRERAWP